MPPKLMVEPPLVQVYLEFRQNRDSKRYSPRNGLSKATNRVADQITDFGEGEMLSLFCIFFAKFRQNRMRSLRCGRKSFLLYCLFAKISLKFRFEVLWLWGGGGGGVTTVSFNERIGSATLRHCLRKDRYLGNHFSDIFISYSVPMQNTRAPCSCSSSSEGIAEGVIRQIPLNLETSEVC